MINNVILEVVTGGLKAPDSGRNVDIYNYHASDSGGAPPNGTKIDDCVEIGTTGVYTVSLSESKKCTIVVDGLVVSGGIGVLLDGETALADSIATSSIQDDAVTHSKASFVRSR